MVEIVDAKVSTSIEWSLLAVASEFLAGLNGARG